MAKFNNNPQKAKNSKKAIYNLFSFCKKHLTVIIISLILTAISSVFTILGPNKIGEITDLIKDGLFSSINLNAILQISIFLACIYILGALCGFLENFFMATATQKISKELRAKINDKLSKLPLKYFSSNSYGDILSRVTNDVDTIAQSLSNTIGNLVASIVQFIGCIIMMFATNWTMAITAILSTLLGLFLMVSIMKKSQKYFALRQQYLGKLNGYIEEMYTGHDVIRVSNAENKVIKQFDKYNNDVKNANFKSQFLSGLMQPLMAFMGNFGYVAVCIVGAVLLLNNNLSLGTITSFMIYVRLFEGPLKQIAQGLTNLQSAIASSERVFDFLDEEEMKDENVKNIELQKIDGNVEFENVSFAYPSNPDKEIIHNFNLKVKSGQKIAIVGPTGAGKTTLVNILMRFFDITGGIIKIDDINTQHLSRTQVQNMFSMVLQDTWLFEGTLRDNLVFNLPNISNDDLDKVCSACGLTHFVKSLPNGYDTVISNNMEISAGQKQLITIARAMLQNSPMLILDEATSSIDTRSEILIQKAMDKLSKEKTSFVIAHRLSTIKNADVILVLKDGDIIEQGTHKNLLKKQGFYYELYNSQFEN